MRDTPINENFAFPSLEDQDERYGPTMSREALQAHPQERLPGALDFEEWTRRRFLGTL